MADGSAATASANLVVTITGSNDLPVNTVPGAQTTAEDVPLALGALSVGDADAEPVQVSLAVVNGFLTISLGGGAIITAGANGTASLTLTGTTAEVNAALTTLLYSTPHDWFGADALTMIAADPAAASDTDTVAITVTPVNDAPVLGNNTFAITNAGTLALDRGEPERHRHRRRRRAARVHRGRGDPWPVRPRLRPAVAITTFTQPQIAAGLVRFVHDGSGNAPTFTVYVADPSGGGAGPSLRTSPSSAAAGDHRPAAVGGGGGGGGGGPVTIPPPPTPSTVADRPPGVTGATSFVRAPTSRRSAAAKRERGEPTVRPAATATAVEKQMIAEMALPRCAPSPKQSS